MTTPTNNDAIIEIAGKNTTQTGQSTNCWGRTFKHLTNCCGRTFPDWSECPTVLGSALFGAALIEYAVKNYLLCGIFSGFGVCMFFARYLVHSELERDSFIGQRIERLSESDLDQMVALQLKKNEDLDSSSDLDT